LNNFAALKKKKKVSNMQFVISCEKLRLEIVRFQEVFVVERRIEVPYEVKVEVPVPQLSRGESVARCRIFSCRIFCESPKFRRKVFRGNG
jgi:hypothetical protein